MCYAFQTTENLFLVMEYLPGGDIFTYLDYGVLSEDVAIFYFAELIVALERMHEQNIVHRDIKTENVMIDKDGHIQLVDFGLSIKLRPRQRTNTYGGSVLYMSPEILSHSEHDTATDMWSLGVLAYHVLTLEFPFGENEKRAPERIINDDPIIEGLSLEMTDFILTLLVKDPAKRPSAKEVKKHPVFKGIDWEKLEKKELESANDPPFMEDPFDTGNFDKEFTQEKPICESSAVPTKQFLAFKGYYYIAPELSENNNNECGASSSRNALRNIETSENNDNKMEGRTDVFNFSKKIDILKNREAEGYVDNGAVSISHFDLIQLLGKGTFGKVFLGRKNRGIDKNVPYAVKVISKKDIFNDNSGKATNQAINERQQFGAGYYYIAPELSENNNNECGASSSRNALRNIETNTPHKFVTPETLNSGISSACKKWIRSSDSDCSNTNQLAKRFKP
ncbi:Ribosomal protein S6 kinase beta-1 [Pseudolycoriella hygida]|uniref:Ribosomal protein S6 kinase beta-1 n=1 Tax=Pseudolycoriella hygida TaxID=35572 RepID=A0A9Q0S0W7_9DIPT|nr:Ribosomal protein S6 kinase beta-1 [Pseudolycoriella hygida]